MARSWRLSAWKYLVEAIVFFYYPSCKCSVAHIFKTNTNRKFGFHMLRSFMLDTLKWYMMNVNDCQWKIDMFDI